MQDAVIQIQGLTKRYGSIVAVNDLSMDVPRGRIFGLLGPNGSGKSTTLSILLGLTRQTSGSFTLFGGDAAHMDALRRIGAIVETPAFYPYLSGRRNLAFFQGIAGRRDRDELDRLLETVGLSARADDKFQTYSLGMKQRLGLAYALIGDPEVLILDEPTNGMDPSGMAEIRELVRSLGTGGRTVLISSHLLHEVEMLCDSVAILSRGRLIAQGDVADLLGSGEQIQLRTTDDARARELLATVEWVHGLREEEGYLVADAPAERSGELTAALSEGRRLRHRDEAPHQEPGAVLPGSHGERRRGPGLILHILSLLRWEWFKLRRRWFPWILLAILVAFTQLMVWIPFLESDGIEFTESFVLPGSISFAVSAAFGFAIVLMMSLASSVMGTEYGWGTLRTVISRGSGRWQFLAAKFGLVILAGLAALIIVAIGVGISSLAATAMTENGDQLSSSANWSEVVVLILKAAYVLVPYALLAIALTVLTSSATVGLALTVGYHIAEQIAVPVLTVFVDGFDTVAGFALGISANALISGTGDLEFIFLVTTLGRGDFPGTTQAALVLLAYSAIFGAAALYLFQRRDITGAKGT